MARLPFSNYAPDLLDLNGQVTRFLRNCVPKGDGYGPWHMLSALTQTLPARCRGFFLARHPTDGTVAIFAGTSNKLYKLDNTTFAWADVSKGAGTYTTLPVNMHWTFAQFGSRVIASQQNDVMQSFVVGTSSAFADLAGSPPRAGWLMVIGSFVVALDIQGQPNRAQWCGFGDPTNWTAGVSQSDLQDFPDLGRTRCGEEISNLTGVILQENGIRRMVYAAGSAVIFQIEKMRTDVGILAPYSLAVAGGMAHFLSTKGFAQLGADGSFKLIGEESVNRTMLGQHEASAPADVKSLAYDSGAPELIMGAADPRKNLYVCVYKSQTGAPNLFDKGFVFNWGLERWGPIEQVGEFLEQVAAPGLTLEALDAVTPGAQAITGCANNGSGLIRVTVGSTAGWTTNDVKTITQVLGTVEANNTWKITVVDATHIDLQGSSFVNAYTSGGYVGGSIDAFATSLDAISTSSLLSLAAFGSDHKLGFFTGDTSEAVLATPEQEIEGQRIEINGVRPVTDAPVVYGSIIDREHTGDSNPVTSSEVVRDTDGNCPMLEEGNLIRGRIRIPATTLWNYAAGVELDSQPSGSSRAF